jgi:hypothetical protein
MGRPYTEGRASSCRARRGFLTFQALHQARGPETGTRHGWGEESHGQLSTGLGCHRAREERAREESLEPSGAGLISGHPTRGSQPCGSRGCRRRTQILSATDNGAGVVHAWWWPPTLSPLLLLSSPPTHQACGVEETFLVVGKKKRSSSFRRRPRKGDAWVPGALSGACGGRCLELEERGGGTAFFRY